EENLDPQLGPFLGRHLPFFPGILLRGHRLAGLGALVVSPAGHWRQLDCCVLPQPPDRRFHQRQLQNAPRPGRLQFPGCCLRALSPGCGRPPGALAHPLLDVSPQAVLEDLRSQVSVRRAGGALTSSPSPVPPCSPGRLPRLLLPPDHGTTIELATAHPLTRHNRPWRDPPFVLLISTKQQLALDGGTLWSLCRFSSRIRNRYSFSIPLMLPML